MEHDCSTEAGQGTVGREHRLRAALADARHPAAGAALEWLRDKGLAHDHVRLQGTGLLARIPKQSQLDLSAADALAYEAACFERAAPGAHTPALHGVLPPSDPLPRGALLVTEVDGRPTRLPCDLGAVARSLAALHALPVPPPAHRAPLRDAPDALWALVAEIEAQAAHAEVGPVPPAAVHALRDGLARLHGRLAQPHRPPRCLIAFDAHPGNFLLDANGRAWLVDLEKCRYAYPGLDLAHATLYTSTTWDVDTRCTLSPAQVLAFYTAWAEAVGASLADAARPWHAPLRHAMWLWSLSWCAKWQALSARPARPGADGEDWSAERSDPALVAHVRERVGHYLSGPVVQQVLDELEALDRAWGA